MRTTEVYRCNVAMATSKRTNATYTRIWSNEPYEKEVLENCPLKRTISTCSRGPSPLTMGPQDTLPVAAAFTETISAYFKGADPSKNPETQKILWKISELSQKSENGGKYLADN
ncbi:SH3-containing GRB2-like protein 3-interacting protein 1 [Tachysurus ichikawai]